MFLWGNELVRRRWRQGKTEIKLTPEGWVYLIVLGFITVGAVLRNVNLLIAMAGMMYAPLLLNWRLAIRRLKSFHASRRFPKRIQANELTSVQWTCENRLPGVTAWNVVICDSIERVDESCQTLIPVPHEEPEVQDPRNSNGWLTGAFRIIAARFQRRNSHSGQSSVKLVYDRVDACQSVVRSYRAFFAIRGKYSAGPAVLSTTFPFGLIVSRIHYRKTEPLFVGPEIGQLHPTWERRVQSIASGSDSIMRRRSLEECEFYALRPWRSGDSKRNIHWRTSAKFGQPIVKQHDQPNNRDFALMLDLYSANGDDTSANRCELGLSFAATAILQIGNAVQGQIAIGICGQETEYWLSRTQQNLILEVGKRLAVAHWSDQPRVAESLVHLSGSVSRGTPIYVISSRPRPPQLDLHRLVTNSGTGEQDQLAKRLKLILPMVRWLEVDSEEFRSMFTMVPDSPGKTGLKQLSTRLVANVKY